MQKKVKVAKGKSSFPDECDNGHGPLHNAFGHGHQDSGD